MPQNILDLRKIKKTESELDDKNGIEQIEKEERPQPIKADTAKDNVRPEFSWEASEFEKTTKTKIWFLVLGAITLAFTATAVLLKNYFFAAFLIIAGWLIGWSANRGPRRIRFSITPEGISFDTRLYLFEDLKSFWIFFDPPLFNELSIKSKKAFMPFLKAPLGGANADEIWRVLKRYLPEEKQEEAVSAYIWRIIGF